MSSRHQSPFTVLSPLALRRLALSSAVSPLLELLEGRNLFSAAPTAAPGGPYTVAEGGTVLISGLTSSDTDGTVASYQWDTNYTPGHFHNRIQNGTWNFVADNSGSRTIALRVGDNDGDVSAIQTATVTITDVAPTLTLTAPASVDEGAAANFTWSYTDPSATDVVTAWDVDFGDGTTATYAGNVSSAAHTYAQDGSYAVVLTSTQADGQTSVTHNLTVNDVVPLVTATAPHTTIDEGEMVQMDFASPNRAGTLDSWTIDWGDGRVDLLDPARSHATHFYTDSGNYTATIKAQEPDGGFGSSTVNYVVNNVAPTVALTGVPATGVEGTAITVGSTVSDPGVDDTQTYGWTVYRNGSLFTLPGGTDATHASFTFTPTDNGSYVTRLTVTDDEGAQTTVNGAPIVVANVAPTATITGTPGSAINEGAAVNLTAVPVDAGTEDTFTYAWSVTKDGSAFALPSNADVTHSGFAFTPTDNGSYVATVVVTDDDLGSVSVSTAAITVNNVAPTATATAPGTALEGSTVHATSTVTDPGAADTQSYAWSVEKQTGTGNGILTLGGGDYGEIGALNFAFPPAATLTARMSIDPASNSGFILRPNDTNYMRIGYTKSGTDVQFFVANNGGTANATLNATPLGTMFDLAVTVDATTGAVQFYVDGAAVTTTGTIGVNTFGTQHTHFGTSMKGTFDQVSVYNSILSPTDVASVHADTAITATLAHQWNFNDAAGATVAANSANSSQSIQFYSSFSFSGATPIFTPFTLPAGLVTTGNTFDFVPTDNGTYSVKLSVTDKDGGVSNTQSGNIVVSNVAPTATLSGDYAGNEGATLNYSVAVVDPGSIDTQTYLWSVTKGGVNYTSGLGATNASTFSFVPNDNAAYVVTVRVTDKDGGVGTASHAVTVANVAPVPTITGTPASATPEGTAITLGSTVTDPGSLDTQVYLWSVTKDGAAYTSGLGATNASGFTFTPEDNGNYVVTLAVTDNNGGTGSISTAAIVVSNVAPTVAVSGEPGAAINEGDPVALTATGADAGSADLATLAYAWTITKDGAAYTPAAGTVLNAATLAFAPTDNGTYVATVTITDKDGDHASADSLSIVANNVAPTSVITGAPATSPEGTALSLGATTTDPGTADTQGYAWSVTKDGVAVDLTGLTTTAATFNFTPRDNGAYVVSLTTTDDDNAATTTTASFTATNVAPAPVITGAGTANEDAAVSLSVAANDPGLDDTQIYLWSVTRNGSAYTTNLGATNGSTFAFTPNLYGSYVASVTVTDSDGAATTVTKTISVANLPPANLAITGMPTGPIGEGSMISLHGSATDASGETGLTYAWSVKRDGVPFALLAGSGANTANLGFVPTDNGLYRATLAVTDSGSLTTTATTSNMIVTNALPYATVSGAPGSSILEGAAVTLTVNAADPGAEDTLTYAWSVTKDGAAFALPAGTPTTAASFTFNTTDQGSYVAKVVVTDDDGGFIAVSTDPIVATNVPPVASISGTPSGNVNEGSAVTLTGSAIDPGTADVLTYSWSVTKNGSPFVAATTPSATGQAFSFTPDDEGSYVATLTVNDGLASNSVSTTTITAINVAPAGSISGPATGTEGSPLTVTATATDAGVHDTLGYAWTVKKDGVVITPPAGTVTNAAYLVYSPPNQGSYEFDCVVSDGHDSVTLTQTVAVSNVAPTAAVTGVPATGSEGTALTVGSTASDVPADTLGYAWSVARNGVAYTLDSGVNVHGTGLTFTPSDNGSYVVSLTVTDGDGGSTTVAGTPIVVANVAPTASVTGDSTGNEGSPVSVAATAADVSPGDQAAGFTYAWSVTKNGQPFTLPSGTTVNAASFAFTPTNDGAYVASVVVTDRDGGQVTATRAITVANVAPTAAITGTPTAHVNEGSLVSVTGTGTDAGTDDTLTYSWSVAKNGSSYLAGTTPSATGQAFSFTPTDNGSYVVTLTVSDGTTSTSIDSAAIVVDNVAPTGTIAGPATGLEGSALTLTATGADAGAADTLGYQWSVTQDGNPVTLPSSVVTNTATLTYTPANQGAFVFTCTITDSDGAATPVTKSVAVSNVAPTVSQTGVPATGVEGSLITVGSVATDPGADSLAYGWTVYKNGNHVILAPGTVIDQPSFSFTPTDDGSYVIRLSVNDGDGGLTTVNSTPIVVANAAPVVAISGPASVAEGQASAFTSTVTDAGPDDTAAGFTYAWSVKQGNTVLATGNAAAFNFTPTVHGTYAVKLIATDKDGLATTSTTTLTATNVAPTNLTITGATTGLHEGDAVALNAAATDASGDPLTYTWQVLDGEDVFASGDGRHINFTAARGTYRIEVSAVDTAGAEVDAHQDITVANVAPTAAITAPSGTVLIGNAASFGLTINDVPATQGLNVVWDFGDGQSTSNDFVGRQTVAKKHTYAAHGTYTVTATIGDGQDATVVTRQVTVSEAGIIADPIDPTKTALVVIGSDANDSINVTQGVGGTYGVTFNGTNLGTDFAPTGRVYVYGNGGSNTINVSGNASAVVFAGALGSTVTTGAGNDVIVGSTAADKLSGGDGRDVIFGMAGPDTIHGGNGEDLVIAGGGTKTDSLTLGSLMTKWADPTMTTAARRTAVKATFGKQLIADAGGNTLYGDAGNDWLVYGSTDKVKDLTSTDLVN